MVEGKGRREMSYFLKLKKILTHKTGILFNRFHFLPSGKLHGAL